MRGFKVWPLLMIVAALILMTSPWWWAPCSEVRGAAVLSIPAGNIARGSARVFCYSDHAGKKIRFLLARGEDGKLRSIFDACHQCFSFHKGFAIAKGAVVCRLCGNRYKIDNVMAGKASCVPVALTHTEHGNTTQIKVSDLEVGRSMF